MIIKIKWVEIKRLAMGVMVIAGMMSAMVAAPSNLQKIFNDAKANYEAGEYEKAAVGFRKVLKYQPSYVYARKYLAQTEAKIKKGTKPAISLEDKLAKIKVPSVAFEGASLGDVLTFITAKSSEISGGTVVANFIYKGPKSDRDTKTVTLKLNNLPMTELIRYVGQLTSTRFKYEEFAVVGTPTTTAVAGQATAGVNSEQNTAGQTKPKFDD